MLCNECARESTKKKTRYSDSDIYHEVIFLLTLPLYQQTIANTSIAIEGLFTFLLHLSRQLISSKHHFVLSKQCTQALIHRPATKSGKEAEEKERCLCVQLKCNLKGFIHQKG